MAAYEGLQTNNGWKNVPLSAAFTAFSMNFEASLENG